MFILTDGKNYVMKNPMQNDRYMQTTSPVQATQFTYKQAKGLLQKPRAYMRWVKDFSIVNTDTGENAKTNISNKGNGGIYLGENAVDFDINIINHILKEKNSLLGLAGWNSTQLETYKNQLKIGLSKYDCAEADIEHVIQEYKEKNEGKNPQAHKMAKLGYMLTDVRVMHGKIKQCIDYISVMQDAITYHYTLEKLKLELSKAEHTDYKGRTEYYQMALDILK